MNAISMLQQLRRNKSVANAAFTPPIIWHPQEGSVCSA